MQPVNNLKSLTEALNSKDVNKIRMDTLSDSHVQPIAVVTSSEVAMGANTEIAEQDRAQELKMKVSESSLNSEITTEGIDPSKEMQKQEDTYHLSDESAPPQLKKESHNIVDIPVQDNNDDDDYDDDEVPTAPPPPIPDLPPPPDDLPLEMDLEEPFDPPAQDDPPPIVNEPAKPAAVTAKSSFRTIKKKEEWTRKSAELDSVMMDPLPLLISTKPSRNQHLPDPLLEVSESPIQTRNEYPLQRERGVEVEVLTSDDVLHDSAESLPSLPETPPPELPDGPPPDLPSSFSLDGLEFEGETFEENVISETLLIPPEDDAVEESEAKVSSLPTFEDTKAPAIEIVQENTESMSESERKSSSESSTPMEKEQPQTTSTSYSDKVQLRKPRRAANGISSQDVNLQRRSAFDALVATEPTSEEKKEPRLTAEQRRSLALEASRRSDADTSPFLERWNISVPSSKPDAKEEKDKGIAMDVEQPKERVEAMEIAESKEIAVDVNSRSGKGAKQDNDLLSIKELNPVRPKSIAGADDLQPFSKRASEEVSRWSLPPDSHIFQSINTIPEPTSNLTSEMKAKWKKSHLLTSDGNPSLSASTGQLFSKRTDTRSDSEGGSKTGMSSSWRALHSSSESLPHFVGLRKKSPSAKQTQPLAMSPLAASVSVASTSSKEESASRLNKEESASAEVDQESSQQISESTEHRRKSPQQISYAQKLGIESRASLRKRRSLVLNDDDQTPLPQEDSLLEKVPLRKKVKNLQLASVMVEGTLDSPRPASLVLDRDILKVKNSTYIIWC